MLANEVKRMAEDLGVSPYDLLDEFVDISYHVRRFGSIAFHDGSVLYPSGRAFSEALQPHMWVTETKQSLRGMVPVASDGRSIGNKDRVFMFQEDVDRLGSRLEEVIHARLGRRFRVWK